MGNPYGGVPGFWGEVQPLTGTPGLPAVDQGIEFDEDLPYTEYRLLDEPGSV